MYINVLMASGEDPPLHLALGDGPRCTCRDTQPSEELSAYFPQTPIFSQFPAWERPVIWSQPAGDLARRNVSSRLRTCQWSKRMPLNLNLHPHPRFYFQSSLSLFQLGPASLKWSISSEYSPAVWKERGPVFLQAPSSAYFLTFILPLFLSYAVW